MLFTNPINREVLINIFENNIEFWNKTKNLIKESERLRLFLPKINNPGNFLQFIRELGGELYGFPPGRTLAINDIVNFAFLFPVILNAPHVLEGGCNEIKRYMLDNKLPIPSTWDKPKTLPKKYQLLWDKNIINVDTNKILGFNLNQIDFKKNKFFPLKIKK